MLKLKTLPAEPFWLDILPERKAPGAKGKKPAIAEPAQRTLFRPATMSMILVARQQAAKALLAALPKANDGQAPAPAQTDAALPDAAGRVAFVVAMAQLGIVAWEGVGDAQGNPVPPTPEAIAAYMADWRVYDAVDRLYVQPAIETDDEKNASAPSQNGTSGAKTRATHTAATAK